MADTLFVNATASIPGTVVVAPFLNDVNTATYDHLSTVVGTNAITATGPLSLTAYATGQNFYLVPTGANTGATTINISGLGVRSITKNGAVALVAGDLAVGAEAHLVYDGTRFQLINPQSAIVFPNQPGRLIGTQTFVSSGTYTPTAGTVRILVVGVGSGGGGGGCVATIAGQISVGSGGGSGGYGSTFLTSGFSGNSVVIGAAGAGVSGLSGTAGGVCSFGAGFSLNGGSGGAAGSLGVISSAGGVVGGTSVGGTVFNITGNTSSPAVSSFTQGYFRAGDGAISPFGQGGAGAIGATGGASTTNGTGASGRGAGGGGAGAAAAGAGASQGGAGTAGMFIVYEYA